jgi:O-antigen ligase
MQGRLQSSLADSAPLIGFVLLLTVVGGYLIAQSSAGVSLGAVLVVIVLFIAFLNPELALHIILLSMLLSPEIVVGGVGGISLGKPEVKGTALVLRMEDLVLCSVGVAWIARMAIFKELGLIRRSPLNPAILCYCLSLIIATLLGVLVGGVGPLAGFFFTLKYIEYFVVYFVTVNYVQDAAQVRRLLTTAFVTCAIAAVMGIAQIPSGERVSAPFEGKFGEPNTFGGYLVFMLALILAQVLTASTLPTLFGWSVFAGLVTLPFLYTLSRSSWIAAIPMLLTLVLLSRRRLLLMSLLGALMILGPLAFPKQVVDRFNYTFHEKTDRGSYTLAGSRLDLSTSARFDSWKQGLTGWTKSPFFGYGVTGFAFMDAQYMRVLVETGLIGLIAFLWLFWRTLRVAWDAHRRFIGTRIEGLTLGYLAGFAAMVTHSLGANTFIIVRIMEPFWFMTGIIVALPHVLLDLGSISSRVVSPHPPGQAEEQDAASLPMHGW